MTQFPTLSEFAPIPRCGAHDVLRHLPLALFEEIDYGLLVCDGEARISFANLAARHELAATSLLSLRGDCLRRAAHVSGDLERAVRVAALRGHRCLLRLAKGQERLTISVVPLHLPGSDKQQVLVMFGRRRACSELGLEMLANSYGLTMAERRVLAGLLSEANPREIAAEFGVALSTIRTQISSMRSKLNARNIEGLLLRAAEVPPVTSALRLARCAPPKAAFLTAASPVSPVWAAA
jgi:DNA-binding CsgD family transcriptional regulator